MSVINTLKERVEYYENLVNPGLLKKLPLIITLNGRSFKKVTSLLPKPFSSDFIELMCGTMIKLSQEIDGTVFAYSFNDEIVLVSRNDQSRETSAWYDNNVQKIVSATAAIATLEFNRLAKMNGVELFGDPVFTAKTFVVPNITEAINVLVAKQQQAFHTALYMACFYELVKNHSPDTVRQTLHEKSPQEKAELLFEQCGIDFNNYPLPFKRGMASYRIPKVIPGVDQVKNKLSVDMEIPIFTRDHDFLGNIFNSGRDIFRARDV